VPTLSLGVSVTLAANDETRAGGEVWIDCGSIAAAAAANSDMALLSDEFRAACRADWTAGSKRPISTEMMMIMTNNSTRVKPGWRRATIGLLLDETKWVHPQRVETQMRKVGA
jgi:hypothetical protein